jgi:hypothetical protein
MSDWFRPKASPLGIAEGGAYMGQIWFDNGYAASIRLEPTDWTKGVPLYEVGLILGTPESWGLLDASDALDCDREVIRYATGAYLLDVLQQIRSL